MGYYYCIIFLSLRLLWYTFLMKVHTLVFILGVFVYSAPFWGFPEAWRSYMLFFAGLSLIVLSFIIRYKNKKYLDTKKDDVTYVEKIPHNENDSFPRI
jgi:membrane protein implicated in regulation of membrane protease activity